MAPDAKVPGGRLAPATHSQHMSYEEEDTCHMRRIHVIWLAPGSDSRRGSPGEDARALLPASVCAFAGPSMRSSTDLSTARLPSNASDSAETH
jgi:hypothetical protein